MKFFKDLFYGNLVPRCGAISVSTIVFTYRIGDFCVFCFLMVLFFLWVYFAINFGKSYEKFNFVNRKKVFRLHQIAQSSGIIATQTETFKSLNCFETADKISSLF